ncbi:unnamed protein product [Diplocarpon coronariae]
MTFSSPLLPFSPLDFSFSSHTILLRSLSLSPAPREREREREIPAGLQFPRRTEKVSPAGQTALGRRAPVHLGRGGWRGSDGAAGGGEGKDG